jgi:hypothetical protein
MRTVFIVEFVCERKMLQDVWESCEESRTRES